MDDVLLRVSLEDALAQLTPIERDLVRLSAALSAPDEHLDYLGTWPPTTAAVGLYIGMKYLGRPLSEGAVRSRRKKAHLQMRRFLGGMS